MEQSNAGSDVSAKVVPETDAAIADRLLRGNVPCYRCGYNLRGQRRWGDCPECGRAVARSIHPKRLCFADPAWVGSLMWGMNWLVVCVLVTAAWAFLGVGGSYGYMFFQLNSAANPTLEWTVITMPGVVVIGTLLGVPFALFYIAPVWLITRPEPGDTGKAIVRRVTRWSAVLAVVAGLLTILVVYFLFILFILFGWWLYIACLVLWAITLIGMNLLLIRFAWYAPRRALMVEHLFVLIAIVLCGWGIGTCVGLMASGTVTAALGIHEDVTFFAILFVLAMIAAFLLLCALMISFLLWWIVLMLRYRAMLSDIHTRMTASVD